jgi:hypothetical protein
MRTVKEIKIKEKFLDEIRSFIPKTVYDFCKKELEIQKETAEDDQEEPEKKQIIITKIDKPNGHYALKFSSNIENPLERIGMLEVIKESLIKNGKENRS